MAAMTRKTVRRAAGPAILLALIAVATWPLTVGGRIIARGDLLLYFYPLRDFAAQAVREGRLPLWNPYTFMGAPFLANSQAGFFYPFNLLLAWLPADQAIAWQIPLHLAIAGLGAWLLARKGFGLRPRGALVSGLAFGLGGYLGAQVEHINQVQALAWLPLMVLCALRLVETAAAGDRRAGLRHTLRLAVLIALQAFAGHTQSLYISLLTVGLAAVLRIALAGRSAWRARPVALTVLLVAGAGVLGGLLAAAQLLPTLELSGQSARAGGLPLNEVGSFSWRPWVAARALLPTLGDPLFPEYVFTLGFSGLGLALAGVILPGRDGGARSGRAFGLLLFGVGVVLALGIATPLFNVLYRFLPGFNLFRAQARWLIMAALGASVLIGRGAEALSDPATPRRWRVLGLAWLGVLGVIVAGLVLGARLSPEAEYRGLPAPAIVQAWVALAAMASLLIGLGVFAPRARAGVALAFPIVLGIELLLTAQGQPYTRTSDRGALTDLRPATTHLLVEYEQRGAQGRVLALSGLFFDPGDLPEQRLIYASAVGADGFYDRIIAAKHKEILSPNLSLYYRLPSLDGYDGGLLPLRRYVDYVSAFVAREKGGTLDGRLRETLHGVPAERWLDATATRFVIADKTADVFIDGVYYDLLFTAPLAARAEIALRPYASTSLGIVLAAPPGTTRLPFTATVAGADGAPRIVAGLALSPTFATRLDLGGRHTPLTLTLETPTGSALRALTSIDASDGTFLSQALGGEQDLRLVYSGDVKIYENAHAAPRAFVQAADGARRPVDLHDDSPERVRVSVPSGAGGQLVLRDACYPGWVASVDGREVAISCVDGFFRGIDLPAGAQDVVFRYAPGVVNAGLILSLLALLAVAIIGRRVAAR